MLLPKNGMDRKRKKRITCSIAFSLQPIPPHGMHTRASASVPLRDIQAIQNLNKSKLDTRLRALPRADDLKLTKKSPLFLVIFHLCFTGIPCKLAEDSEEVFGRGLKNGCISVRNHRPTPVKAKGRSMRSHTPTPIPRARIRIHTRARISMHTCTRVRAHTEGDSFPQAFMCTHVRTRNRKHTHTHTQLRVQSHAHANARTRKCAHASARTRKRAHTHVRTYTHAQHTRHTQRTYHNRHAFRTHKKNACTRMYTRTHTHEDPNAPFRGKALPEDFVQPDSRCELSQGPRSYSRMSTRITASAYISSECFHFKHACKQKIPQSLRFFG